MCGRSSTGVVCHHVRTQKNLGHCLIGIQAVNFGFQTQIVTGLKVSVLSAPMEFWLDKLCLPSGTASSHQAQNVSRRNVGITLSKSDCCRDRECDGQRRMSSIIAAMSREAPRAVVSPRAR